MSTLRQLILQFSCFFFAFNLFVFFVGKTSIILPISTSTKTEFMNIPFSSQPFQLYPSGPIKSTSLTIDDLDGNSREVTPSGPFYRFRSNLDHFSLSFNSPIIQSYLEVQLWYPQIGYFILFQRFIFFLILFFSSIFSYITPLLRSTFPSNLICLLYMLYRLQLLKTSPLFDAFATSLFWVGYVHIVLSQSKAVCLTTSWIHATMHAITIGTSIALFIGLYEPSVALFMGVIWLFIPLISVYLFQIGKVMVHPALLAVHFGFFVAVSAAVYFSAFARGFWEPSVGGLWCETLDLSALAVFVVFQICYLIGDKVRGRGPDASLGRLTRRGQIDNLLNMLAAREEEELKVGAAFA